MVSRLASKRPSREVSMLPGPLSRRACLACTLLLVLGCGDGASDGGESAEQGTDSAVQDAVQQDAGGTLSEDVASSLDVTTVVDGGGASRVSDAVGGGAVPDTFSTAVDSAGVGTVDTGPSQDISLAAGSCVGKCGAFNSVWTCQCDKDCDVYNDCCPDLSQACGSAPAVDASGSADAGMVGDGGVVTMTSCKGKCGQYSDDWACQCDTLCSQFDDCCGDFLQMCPTLQSGSSDAASLSDIAAPPSGSDAAP